MVERELTRLFVLVDGKSSAAPTFAYKKWSLLNQDLLVDVVSCGRTQSLDVYSCIASLLVIHGFNAS